MTESGSTTTAIAQRPSAVTGTGYGVDTTFDSRVHDHFEHAVAGMLRRDRLATDHAGTACLLRHLVEDEGIGSPSARALLRSSGIRDQWNTAFAVDRAELVARWLRPWVADAGTVLDLLAGDCLLTGRLTELAGIRITAAERLDHYPAIAGHDAVDLVPCERLETGGVRADTVLLCAVLHHEDRPAALRDLALATGARRFVVVENCVDEENDPDFHLLMDLFYNRCLNDFGSSCTREHRTVGAWRELLADFGEVVHTGELRTVPGLPFPYQLLVFEV